MTALSQDRATPSSDGKLRNREVAANAKIFAGALVVLNANGFAQPGSTATGLIADGMALSRADNSGGADGAIRLDVEPRNMWLANSSGGDAITRAMIGRQNAYIVDDQTVAATNGSGTRSVAGAILAVSSTLGVLVSVGILHV